MAKPNHGVRVHLSLVHPWQQAVACYFAQNPSLDDLVWEFPPDYSAGDIVVHIVPARGLAILNVEVFATDSDAEHWDVEDSAGAFPGGISVRAVERRLGAELPTAPATLDADLADRLLDAITDETRDPTQQVDKTECLNIRDEVGVTEYTGLACLCCEGSFTEAAEPHLVDPTDHDFVFDRVVYVCRGCHSRLHELYGPSIAELLYEHRPACPVCSATQTQRLLWGMPPGLPPLGTTVMGCVISGVTPEYGCGDCGIHWSESDADNTSSLVADPPSRPRMGERVRARLPGAASPWVPLSDPDRPGRLVIGRYDPELIYSAWGIDLRHRVITDTGHEYFIDPRTVRLADPEESEAPAIPSNPALMRIWMEITDRNWDSVGEDISVARFREDGHQRLSSSLATQMLPGDIVMHWWWSHEHPPSLVGWSVVVDFPSMTDFGTATDGAGETDSGIWVQVPLNWKAELETPISLPDVRRRASAIIALEDQLKKAADGVPLYFPFMRTGADRIKGAWPHYLARFPVELLDILPGLPSQQTLTTTASATLRSNMVERNQNDPRFRAAISEHAITLATDLLTADGYEVTDVSGFRGYALRATRGRHLWQVHVIGRPHTDMSTVELELGATAEDSGQVALIVVDRIHAAFSSQSNAGDDTAEMHEDGPVTLEILVAGGRIRTWFPWHGSLLPHTQPTVYRSTLGPPTAEIAVPQPYPLTPPH